MRKIFFLLSFMVISSIAVNAEEISFIIGGEQADLSVYDCSGKIFSDSEIDMTELNIEDYLWIQVNDGLSEIVKSKPELIDDTGYGRNSEMLRAALERYEGTIIGITKCQ